MEKNEKAKEDELIQKAVNEDEDNLKEEKAEEKGKKKHEEKEQGKKILQDMKKEIEEKDKGIQERDKNIKELTDKFIRLQADFMNYKKRSEKEKESIISYAAEDIITSILPVLDDFERALVTIENKEDSFYKGVEIIYNELLKILKKNGLKEISCLKEKFDPNYHHAVCQEENENYEEGSIIEVFQKGYMLNDKVLRPSMVKIAK
ncbi:nucleotide exchange factor GrpE [Sporanaerobacter sp. PP17-6a]|uniref:nucleotide exchange factor GrpE n=1 Tax=Sporanaerobacter sp. PP17-6a TaxID=1891289 RepID=UPI00089FA53A|nr:nucleotide exchange factor GrpE [Sporanaerobacter sp. PP17-6a]SCL84411.1 HSP-70 cofactor [Sporanaerobacter sp. PP17-6a]